MLKAEGSILKGKAPLVPAGGSSLQVMEKSLKEKGTRKPGNSIAKLDLTEMPSRQGLRRQV
jgi:hypothetical protein